MRPTSESQHALEPGTVIAIRGTLDKRDDTVRATAQKVKMLTPESAAAAGETSERGGDQRLGPGARGSDGHIALPGGESLRTNCEPCAKSWHPRLARSPLH